MAHDQALTTTLQPDARAFLGRGWAHPVAGDGQGGLAMAEYEQDIAQALRIILDTEPGERVMRPDFGAGLRGLLFEPINTSTLALAQHRALRALILWEPRIDQIGVEVKAEPHLGILRISVRYRVRSTNTFYNLVHPFYAQEGRDGAAAGDISAAPNAGGASARGRADAA